MAPLRKNQEKYVKLVKLYVKDKMKQSEFENCNLEITTSKKTYLKEKRKYVTTDFQMILLLKII